VPAARGLGNNPADNDFIDRALEELLARPAVS
jgi:hypothetical protein